MNSLYKQLLELKNSPDNISDCVFNEILNYYRKQLIFDDSLSGSESLIINQIQLLNIKRFIEKHKLTQKSSVFSQFKILIRVYDYAIYEQYSNFSKFEKMKIVNKYNLNELLDCIEKADENCTNNNINVIINMEPDQLSNGMRILCNLGFVDYEINLPKKQMSL